MIGVERSLFGVLSPLPQFLCHGTTALADVAEHVRATSGSSLAAR
jgi:hypothetical protein